MPLFRLRHVEARMVGCTEGKLREIAEWCGGTVQLEPCKGIWLRRPPQSHNPSEEYEYFAGMFDWIVMLADGPRRMSNRQFELTYEQVEGE